jgi:N-acetylglucosamine kinase-like BadF-type ATPase
MSDPAATLPAVLAIDGGNSKTDVALAAADGTLLAAVRGPGLPRSVGLHGWLATLAGLVTQAQDRAGGRGLPVARHTSACVANLDLPEEEARFAQALRPLGWSATADVANDTFAVLRAGTPSAEAPDRVWGVAVVCGTGINCVGLDAGGRVARFLALGDLSGDWGGGAFLGRMALWYAMRAEDGRGSDTALRQAVAAAFGLPAVYDIAVGLHRRTIAEDELLRLTPLLFVVAGQGDPVARRIVARQAEEVCHLAVTALRRLDLIERPTPVVLGGSVLTARDPLLMAGIAEGLTARAPRALLRVTDVPPIAGAVLLGLDRVGAGPDAERRLRTTYPGVSP